ncbi:hypothetical protein IE81DRAFT_125722 [Ceraceosorus guamensis]|uniref:Uncharacterized protein n=1 Tax=Ceraceosorus guamensis TaxID=1522189 RepID=A0A316W1U2_9BASI|nr:hypothetical protein IE81DRAFT_125722 [Ceraceosorus guamensis]PWN42521.1 hypothetical protein IE81DRAFT_125722 [Ceraceosorus guamensis]
MTLGILFKQLEQDFSGVDATHQIIVATFWEAQQDSHPVKWIKGRLSYRKVTLDSLKAILFGALQRSALPVEYAFEELGEEAGRQLLVSVIPHLLREDYQGKLLESLCSDCNSAPWRAEAFEVLCKAAQCYGWTIQRYRGTERVRTCRSSISPRSAIAYETRFTYGSSARVPDTPHLTLPLRSRMERSASFAAEQHNSVTSLTKSQDLKESRVAAIELCPSSLPLARDTGARSQAFLSISSKGNEYHLCSCGLWHQRIELCSTQAQTALPVVQEASEDATSAQQEDSEGHPIEDYYSSEDESSDEDASSDEDSFDEVDSDPSYGHIMEHGAHDLFFRTATKSVLARRSDGNVQDVDMDCKLSPNFGYVRAQTAKALPVKIESPVKNLGKPSTDLQNPVAYKVTSTGLSFEDVAMIGPSGSPGDYGRLSESSITPGQVLLNLVPAKSVYADIVLKHTLACRCTYSVGLLYRKGVPPTPEHLKIALHLGLELPDDFFDSVIQGSEFDSGNGGNRDAHSESTTPEYSRSNAVTSVELSLKSQGAVALLSVKENGEIIAVQEHAEGVRQDKLEFATVALRASIDACASLTEQQCVKRRLL